MSLLPEPKEGKKNYKSECGIISRIIKLGFKEIEIYSAWVYYKEQGRGFDSFKIFLWKDGKLIKDVLPLLRQTMPQEIKLDDVDYRTEKNYKAPEKPKTLFGFLSDEN